jgi:hypothetical protein
MQLSRELGNPEREPGSLTNRNSIVPSKDRSVVLIAMILKEG